MSNVFNILNKKDRTVWSVSPQVTIQETLRLMAEKNVGAVLVMDGPAIIGVFSERDFARHSANRSVRPDRDPVKDMMTTQIITVGLSSTTEECMDLMTSRRIRHLPVLEDGKLVGLISIGDVVKQVIEDQRFSITQLERYVTGDVY